MSVPPREIAFESDGLSLTGYLYVPDGTGPFPCVINNHGSHLRSNGSDVSRPHTGLLMATWGFAFFFPHRRGYGNSPGVHVRDAIPAPLGSVDYDEQIVARLDEELRDVSAAIRCVQGMDTIATGRVAVMGSSRGGILSLMAAAAEPSLCGAVNFCGGARQWSDHPKLRQMMLNAAAAVMCPVYLAQSENDLNPAATLELARELERLGKDHECRIYPPWGATEKEGHLFEVNGAQVWGEDVRKFLERCWA